MEEEGEREGGRDEEGGRESGHVPSAEMCALPEGSQLLAGLVLVDNHLSRERRQQ